MDCGVGSESEMGMKGMGIGVNRNGNVMKSQGWGGYDLPTLKDWGSILYTKITNPNTSV